MLKILNDAFGIERAFLTTVHAYTNQQRLADVPADDQRRGRAAAENIIPQQTNAAEVMTELLPALRGRLTGSRSTCRCQRLGRGPGDLAPRQGDPDGDQRGDPHRRLHRRWRRILDYEDEPIVSSDIVRSASSSTFDAQATMVLGERVSKTLAWFDNGWGYAHRVVDLIARFIELDREAA